MDQNTSHAELYWTAFRYFVDELAPGEADAFEQRLADDQSARETLASIVALVGAAQAAAPAITPAARDLRPAIVDRPGVRRPAATWAQRARERAGWAAIGMAASLALIIGLQNFRPALESLPTEIAARDHAAAAELALAWSQAADSSNMTVGANQAGDAHEATDGQLVASTTDADHDLPEINPLHSSAAPDWLVAAMQSNRPRAATEN